MKNVKSESNKKSESKGAGLSFSGAALFFVLIAFVIQVAVLVYERIRIRTENKLLIAALIFVVIILLSTFCVIFDYVRRKIAVERPTQKILDATEKIARGEFGVRLEIAHEYSKYNQYDLIMENVNAMAEELSKNEVLKMDFISNLSHEIKTPLAVIQNGAELLKNENLDAEERAETATTLIAACKRVSGLVGDILKLNKLENQGVQEKKERFDLTETLANIVVEFDAKIEQKGVNLDCDFEELTIVSSKSLIEIVCANLISNAVKFTDAGGKITLSLKKRGENAIITVSDTGAGMSAETGARIFEKFYQGDSSHRQEGNGLGLSLVKKVIDVLGGEISVDSELGKGSTFSVELKDVDCKIV